MVSLPQLRSCDSYVCTCAALDVIMIFKGKPEPSEQCFTTENNQNYYYYTCSNGQQNLIVCTIVQVVTSMQVCMWEGGGN